MLVGLQFCLAEMVNYLTEVDFPDGRNLTFVRTLALLR